MRFTPHGKYEMLIGSIVFLAIGAGLYALYPWLALIVAPLLIWLFAFFRDPNRRISPDPKVMVSPADGMVSDITELESCDITGGPAVRIGIFLNVFNVHVNRMPCDGKVSSIVYKKGKFINALSHAAASSDNESNTILLVDANTNEPVAGVKQIVGLIARRIICAAAVGQTFTRGQRFGMIKFGSRTELYIPKRLGPQVNVKVGQKVQGGRDIMAMLNQPLIAGPAPQAAATTAVAV